MQEKYRAAVRAGLTSGVVLAACELAFGLVLLFLRSDVQDFFNGPGDDTSSLVPVATVWLAFLFLVIAAYFACGMFAAKWLMPLSLKSGQIAAMGAVAGAVAEVVRTVMSIFIDFVLNLTAPLVHGSSADVFNTALENAGLRLVCGMPTYIILAAAVAGISAYAFSTIFFQPEPLALPEHQ